MLAGCSSSTLLSPRHRLRSESGAAAAAAQFPACHFQLPSMSTQRLDLPCSFSRKESTRSQPIRPVGVVGLSVDNNKPLESKTSLRQHIRLPPLATATAHHHQSDFNDEFWGNNSTKTTTKKKKRFAADDGESCNIRAKRKKGESYDDVHEGGGGGDGVRLGQFGGANFWFQPSFLQVPRGINNNPSHQLPFSLTCSGEEERVCYVPSEVITPPLPPLSNNNPWIDSVITEIAGVGEKDGESSQIPVKEASSGSSPSSESQSLGVRSLSENVEEHEVGNGSSNPHHPQQGATFDAAPEDDQQEGEYRGFELVSLLTSCVEAIGAKNIAGVNHFISKLGELASPRGTSISRLSAYYTEALSLRVTRIWPHIFHLNTPRELDRVEDDTATALRILNQVSPIPKFIHFTANEILLRAFEGKDRVHIIDFDIKQGLQWPSLFQSLASRGVPPSHVRITGVGESKQELNETGDRLAGFADALNLPFEFHPVVDRLEDVRLWMLHVKEGETVAVNCLFQLHKTLYDTTGVALRDFLGLIKSTNPVNVVFAEQEAEHNGLSLESRVCNSLKYYSAVFDSIDSGLPLESPVRMKVEEMFAREIRNIVACEGADRLERHDKFGKWKSLMEQGGFRCNGISEREFLQGQMLLKMYPSGSYGVLKQQQQGQEGGCGSVAALTLTWSEEPLYTVSAWAPVDSSIAGSSSSFSQP